MKKGNPLTEEDEERTTVKDKPVVDLVPIENVRFHPNADWRDVVGTSPYFGVMSPMYVGDIKEKIRLEKWEKLTDEEILAAREEKHDSTRQARENDPPEDSPTPEALSDYDVVWIYEWIMKKGNKDYVFKTLNNKAICKKAEEIEEQYAHGRPYVIGMSVIESHKVFPESIVGLGAPVQKEINEIKNQRRDNVMFVLNKRWFAKRGAQVDLANMLKNVPGSVTLMDNPHTDVVGNDFPDITSSAYAEEDRANLGYDELVGTFSSSSINSNRRMNETVGGMEMARGAVNALTEYLLLTFSETWVEPVVKQLVKMEQAYEDDALIIALAADKAQIENAHGIQIEDSEQMDELINQDVNITVNVGIGATDPMQKLEKFLMGVTHSMNIQAQAAQLGPAAPNIGEIQKEIWGRLGYKDGARFMGQNPDVKAAQAQIQQLQQAIQQLQAELQSEDKKQQLEMEKTKMREDGQNQRKVMGIKGDIQTEQMETDRDVTIKQMDMAQDRQGHRFEIIKGANEQRTDRRA